METQRNHLEKRSPNQTTSLMQCLVDRDVLAIAMTERKLTLQTASAGPNLQSIAKTHGDSLPIKALSGIILVTTEFFS